MMLSSSIVGRLFRPTTTTTPSTAAILHRALSSHLNAHTGRVQEIDPTDPYGLFYSKNLVVEKTTTPKSLPDPDGLKFGHTFTDHMLEVDWVRGQGWSKPTISPYHNLSISPACSAIHYAVQIFEGMKAYIDNDGHTRLFRPDMNMKRMNRSALRMSLPTFKEDELLHCIRDLVLLDKHWIPRLPGYSLYIRPALISFDSILGVAPPNEAKLFVILSPVGPYYREGFKPVSLYAGRKYVRACPGGTGDAKVGANYGPTIFPQLQADARGYTQVLWLYGEESYLTEVGTMNMFVHWTNEQGERELITPPLDGTILPGVTRDSILELARSWSTSPSSTPSSLNCPVRERRISMHQLIAALGEGRLHEVFGAGTAAVVSPVRRIHFEGVDYDIPLDPKDPSAGAGPMAKRVLNELTNIQLGKIDHPWSIRLD